MNKMQLFFIFWLAGLAACTPIPENVTRVKECAPIYPDYTDITIPYNIAPMNFMIEGAEGLQVTAYGDTDSLRISGKDKARFPIGKWKKLLLQQKGKSVQVRVRLRYEIFRSGSYLIRSPAASLALISFMASL